MNAVEIEEAVCQLVESAFDSSEFPFAFLEAFGNKATTLKRLKSGNTNQSDIGGVLQRGNIHIKTCQPGQVSEALTSLRESPLTARQKAKFILATDGHTIESESLADDVPPLVCEYKDLPNHFGFFLPLAGITTVRQISENAFDIRATGRLNRLYVELLKNNLDWDTEARREDLNHFFARLIFCFFAEDTGIFIGTRLFTDTIAQMTERDGSNTHEVLAELFRAMNTKPAEREQEKIRPYATSFPYVNGSLFAGSTETPRFSQIARSYLIFVGGLDWKQINPDIFGSMIQAVADDEERGALGMHYTSVPNILKVLNPLFLDDLRAQLADAIDDPGQNTRLPEPSRRLRDPNPRLHDPNPRSRVGLPLQSPCLRGGLLGSDQADSNPQREQGTSSSPPRQQGNSRKLLNLRKRLARIRVFDPACGSGNFLVIAYKEMRQIEAEINRLRGEPDRPSEIPPTNFRGIEIRSFPAEIARLALIIAKFQCDSIYRGELLARAEFLPLEKANWITCGNALRLDWLKICPPTGTGVKLQADDLFGTPLDQAEMDFENAGGETYICGNPPYLGSRWLTDEHKEDLEAVVAGRAKGWKALDYVAGWFLKAADYGTRSASSAALVSTKSICQGQQVAILWPLIFSTGHQISFAHTSFKWTNLASHNAGVTVVIVGLSIIAGKTRRLYQLADDDATVSKDAANINAYLIAAPNVVVTQRSTPISERAEMQFGNHPYYGGPLIFSNEEARQIVREWPSADQFIQPLYGSKEFISALPRACIWIRDKDVDLARQIPAFSRRFDDVADSRRAAKRDKAAQKLAEFPYRFRDQFTARNQTLVVPRVSSGNRPYLPVGLLPARAIIQDQAFALYDAPLWNMGVLASLLHLVWIDAVCGKFKTDYRYSNTLGWNTFPVPPLSDQNKADLTRCAEGILLAREAHFPATIADMYDPERMDAEFPDLRAAHEQNDETLERIYIGRRFKNDTERLEKLFEMYTQMTAKQPPSNPQRKRGKK